MATLSFFASAALGAAGGVCLAQPAAIRDTSKTETNNKIHLFTRNPPTILQLLHCGIFYTLFFEELLIPF
jgi:hypothetical protein